MLYKKSSLNKVLRAKSGCFLWRCSRYGRALKGFVWVLWSANRMSSPSGRPRVVRPRSDGCSELTEAALSGLHLVAWPPSHGAERLPGNRWWANTDTREALFTPSGEPNVRQQNQLAFKHVWPVPVQDWLRGLRGDANKTSESFS